jgi:threonyl-tRNA synthetase
MSTIQEKRHSLAHLLAQAILNIYPDAKLTIGPSTDNGFYYDVDFGTNKVTDHDLGRIQKEMKKILPTWEGFTALSKTPNEALEFFKDNQYKLELIEEIISRGEEITFYKSGEFIDLCRGGHVAHMNEINTESFKLERVAGAYWRGDEKNTMLTRIYGLAFENKEELEAYLLKIEQAKERDHRKLGKELDLFTFSELVGPGLPLFTPKGTAMRKAIIAKIQELQKAFDYQEVWIPHITKPELYMKSGHWDKFKDQLFHVKGMETEFVMKPMNCPHHTQIFASKARSYKELPVRYTEPGVVYRDEQSGELLGLGRVRSITQDDGHVFCTPEQVKTEIKNIVQIIKEFYELLGLMYEGNYWVSLSFSDPATPEKYLGEKDTWIKAEAALEEIAKEENLPYRIMLGEAAFYGPKIDFMFKDAIGRERQLGTVQLDFNMPARFELEYTDKDGSKKTPVMIHRAIAGSLERFLSIIIEHYAGNFPFWMSPVQVAIIPIGDTHLEVAQSLHSQLKELDIRSSLLSSSDNFGKKVKKAKDEKIPYFIIIGDKDIEAAKVTLESRDEGQLGQKSIEEVIEMFKGLK